MSRREADVYRRHHAVYQWIALVLLTFAIVIGGTLLGSVIISSSRLEASQQPSFKYYTSIEIQPGDTLWSIAAAYMSPEYDSVQDYIDEVKELNQLGPDHIHAGQYLTVPYYSRDFR